MKKDINKSVKKDKSVDRPLNLNYLCAKAGFTNTEKQYLYQMAYRNYPLTFKKAKLERLIGIIDKETKQFISLLKAKLKE